MFGHVERNGNSVHYRQTPAKRSVFVYSHSVLISGNVTPLSWVTIYPNSLQRGHLFPPHQCGLLQENTYYYLAQLAQCKVKDFSIHLKEKSHTLSFTVPPSDSVSCHFANSVYVAPKSLVFIHTDSCQQYQATGILIDFLKTD